MSSNIKIVLLTLAALAVAMRVPATRQLITGN